MSTAQSTRVGRPRHVAVIGSGLAGLTTAYLLRREGCEVWLIEKSDRLGFHSASVEIPLETVPNNEEEEGSLAGPSKSGLASSPTPASRHTPSTTNARPLQKWVVDVPMRSFQGGYYPLLIALYRHLGLRMRKTYYTFSFSHLYPSDSVVPPILHDTDAPSKKRKRRDVPYFVYAGASGLSIPELPSRYRRNLATLAKGVIMWAGVAVCQIIILLLALLGWHDLLPQPLSRSSTLADFTHTVARRLEQPFPSLVPRLQTPFAPVWRRFIADLIIPLFGAVGTMTVDDVWTTRVGCLLDYIHCSVGTPHYTLEPGVGAAGVSRRLAQEVARQGKGHLRLGETVTGFDYNIEENCRLTVRCHGGEIEVDHVVVATQPKAASALLQMMDRALGQAAEKTERSRLRRMMLALKEVDSRETIVVTHRDYDLLPDTPDRREINLHLPIGQRGDMAELQTPPLSPASTSAESSRPATPTDGRMMSVPFFAPLPGSVYAMATHVFQPPPCFKGQKTVLQTTNPVVAIDPEAVLGVSRFERALPMSDPTTTLGDLHRSSITACIHLAGSYAHPGIPLLEGCVGSAIRAANAILRSDPQEACASSGTVTDSSRLGGVDWSLGQGSLVGRLWRWRRPPKEYSTEQIGRS